MSANARLRALVEAARARRGFAAHFPAPQLCTDNGAMIAFAGALRLAAGAEPLPPTEFDVRPRWPLAELAAPGAARG